MDAALAVVLAVTAVVPVLAGVPAFGRPLWLGILLALCSTLPLAWRGRWPIPVAGFLLFATAADLVAVAPHEGALQPFIALVLAGYTAGNRAEGRFELVLSGALALAALPVFALGRAADQSIGNQITSYVWLIAAWVVGRVVRGIRLTSHELEIANAALAEQREIAAQAAVTVERGRIAREIHDVIAHNVSMMVVQADAAGRVLRANEPQVRSALETIAGTGRQTVDEMRHLLGVLRTVDDQSADRAPQPGLANLGELAQGLGRSGMSVTWRIEGRPQPLPRALDLSAYRIVQEALTNSLKHAQGGRSQVVVRFSESCLHLDICDTGGRGNSSPHPGGGHGILGMRERAALFGGAVTAGPTAEGFRVTATLPIRPAGSR
jgi:signal transduction histidine kinase